MTTTSPASICPAEDRLHRGVLAVEHAGRGPRTEVEVDAGHLHHRALRGQRAREHGDAADGVDRVGQRVDDLAVGRGRVELGQVLGHGPAGDGEAVAVEQPGVEQVLHHDRHAADAVDVDHVVLAVRLGVGDVGHPRGDLVEVVERRARPGPRVAMASRCSTALVEPPSAMTTAMAFSNASLVMIWRGRMPSSSRRDDGLAATRRRSRRGGGRRPGADAEPGSDMPSASATDAMVLAVNMPAQLPSVGQALRSMASSSASSMVPAAWAPTASNT